ncbi:ABC1 kinase family protein [Plantactinospora sp. GCM10030261]|uniref:ABC1 kinase family protein n=1 Tax=Plantactinospora sp. GCM10030261 TaxID=3273420 RepID=UPI0036162190
METLLGNLLFIPTLLVTLLLFGAVIRRLLGVRVGVVRTVLAAVLAVLVAGHILRALAPEPVPTDAGTLLLLSFLTVCCACLLAMIVLVIAEVIVPDGSLPGPVELVHGWRARLARTRRYSQIVGIAVRHGLGRFLRGRRPTGVDSEPSRRLLARSLRRALDEGGVTFVKLGQQLSTRRDLVPREFVEELTRLQDKATPVPWPRVEAALVAELGRPVAETFAEIDPEPLAAASVAQVHAARLPDGTEVVVKVRRPGVARIVERDLDILLRLARTLETRTLWGRTMGMRTLAAGFAEALREELDFTVECDNLRAVAAALRATARAGVRVPTPVSRLCTAGVLVMDRLPGTPLGQAGDLLAALPVARRRETAAALLDTMLDQVLERGLFHVDVHPGNVLVAENGSVGLLDFGSVGRLDGTTRRALGRLLLALGDADSLTATDALLELVDRPDEIDERELERTLGGLIVRYAAPGATPGATAFTALMRLITTHRLAVPPQVAAVFRAFATLEGTLTLIDPGFDLVTEARRAGAVRVAEALTPPRLRQSMEEELAALLPLLRRLPRRVDRIADAVEHGRLAVNVRLFADRRDRTVVTGLLHQVLLTVLGAAAGLMAVLLLDNRGGPRLTDSVELFAVLGYAMFIIAVVLVLRVLIVIFRPGPD